eukprot:SAG31_NODE_16163_length_720_cov_1.652174_1_plen_103_part_10
MLNTRIVRLHHPRLKSLPTVRVCALVAVLFAGCAVCGAKDEISPEEQKVVAGLERWLHANHGSDWKKAFSAIDADGAPCLCRAWIAFFLPTDSTLCTAGSGGL